MCEKYLTLPKKPFLQGRLPSGSGGGHEKGSVMITTNLGFADWTQVFGDERMTAAFLEFHFANWQEETMSVQRRKYDPGCILTQAASK